MNHPTSTPHISCIQDIPRTPTSYGCPSDPAKSSAIRFGLLIVSTYLMAGCLMGIPMQKEKPSNHFDVGYIEAHPQATRQEVVQKLGIPGAIFRLNENTYYVYDATGHIDALFGMPMPFPPFFFPFAFAKGEGEGEGDALYCLALVFDEKGILHHYEARTATVAIQTALVFGLVPAGMKGVSLGSGIPEKCVQVLWDEEKISQLKIVAQYNRPQYLEDTVLAFGEVDGVPLIAVADWHDTLQFWDVRSDCLMDRSLSGHEASVTTAAFGRLDGEPVVITGTSEGAVRIWDMRTAQLRGDPLRGHEGRITTVALIEVNGVPTVFSGGEDRTVRIWDARSGQRLGELALEGQLLAIGGTGGEPLIVMSSFDETVQLWDVHAAHSLGESLTGHGGLVTAVALGEVDGKPTLASGGTDNTLRLWDARSARPLGVPLRGHERRVTAVNFGEIDRAPVVVSADVSNTMRLWDARTGSQLDKPLISAYEGQITAITLFEVDGASLIASSTLGHKVRNVRLWDVRSGRQLGELMWNMEFVDIDQFGIKKYGINRPLNVRKCTP